MRSSGEATAAGSCVPEAVADAAHGQDQLRSLRLLLELFAQVADVDVDRARVAVGGIAPYALEKHRAAEHSPRAASQRREHLELDVGEPHGLVAHLDLTAIEVDAQVAVLDRLLEALLGLSERRAAQDGSH